MTVIIDAVGSKKAPDGWWMKTKTNMQRLYYIKGGTGYIKKDDGSTERFEKGYFYLHPYNLTANFINDPSDPLDHLYFDFLSAPAIISSEQKKYAVSPAAKTVIDTVEECLSGYSLHDNKELYSSLLSALLYLLSAESSLPTVNDKAILSALDTVHSQYASALSVVQLASKSGFETNYFIRRFRKTMGVTPYAYLRTVRLIKAKELLDAGHPLSSTAEAVGYESSSSLSRALKKSDIRA